MPVGDPVLDYDGLQYYHQKLTAEVTQQINNEFDERHVPIFIDGVTVGTEFYVNGSSGSDTTGDGSQSKPWKTIAHAAQSVAQGYNINSHDVHIYVSGGTYTDRVPLSRYTATTGSITIEPLPDSGAVYVTVTLAGNSNAILHTGGLWTLKNLNCKAILAEQLGSATENKQFFVSKGTSDPLSLVNCNFEFQDLTVALSDSAGVVNFYMVSSTGNIKISGSAPVSWSGTKVYANVSWLVSGVEGIINAMDAGEYNISGAFTNLIYVAGGIYREGASTTWNAVESPTGKKFSVNRGGTLITTQASATALQSHFPGSVDGVVGVGTSVPSLSEPFASSPIYDVTLAEDIPVGGGAGRYTIPFSIPVSAIAFKIITPAVASAASFYLRVKFNNAASSEPMFGVLNFLDTTEQCTFGFVKNDHGILSILFTHGSATMSHLAAEFHPTLLYLGDAQMTEMSLAATSATLPTGTIIKIYGATEV